MGYKVTINGQDYTVPASKCKFDANRPGWMEVSLKLCKISLTNLTIYSTS